MKSTKEDRASAINQNWNQNKRWVGVTRPYSAEDVVRLQGNRVLKYTHAEAGAIKLWQLLQKDEPVRSLGALTGNQGLQQVKAGLQSIYLSGWQVAADANNAGQMYPDQSLYPSDSVPEVVRAINNTLARADQIHTSEGDDSFDWYAPIVADAEAGFGGVLNAFELMKAMIEAGAAGVHFEDQLSSAKKCGHMGGKVLLPTRESVQKLIAARLASDVCNVPTVLFARTDALAAQLLTSDIDARDKEFITGERTVEGFYKTTGGMGQAISRGLSYSPYADLIWFETGTPDLGQAKEFAEAIHEKFPGKMLSYNCSPSFNWKENLNDKEISTFQDDLFGLGYRYQFITLAGFHALNHSMFELACKYQRKGMTGYVELQEKEFEAKALGYTATAHQREVGAGYFDVVAQVISGGESSVTAMEGSTEEEQF